MKGIILAGGLGTRLRPLTFITNKHLLPVFDRPMIDLPINTLKELGVTDIMIVTGGDHLGAFVNLLGDGSSRGIAITYKVQNEPNGIAGALALAEGFVDGRFYVILGDNYFTKAPKPCFRPAIYVTELPAKKAKRFGVLQGEVIYEKPEVIVGSAKVVTGLYNFDRNVFHFLKTLSPSARGELEITEVNNWYLKNGRMDVIDIGEIGWSDMGSFESLLTVANSLSVV